MSTIESYANVFTTALSGPMLVGDLSAGVVSAMPVGLQGGQFRIAIGTELLLVTAGGATTTWTVSRGVEGTTAVTHATGATITHVLTAVSLLAAAGHLNVRAYGAKGDGTTDDTAAIAAAIAAASAAGGGVVTFPAGTCIISSTLVIPIGVSLQGADRSSTLYLKAASNCSMIRFAAGIEDGSYSTLRQFIRDIRLVGNATNQGAGSWHGIELPAGSPGITTSLFAENVWVQQVKGDGFYVGASRMGNTFVRCIAWSCGNNGFSLLSSDNSLWACSGALSVKGAYIDAVTNQIWGGWWFQCTGPAVHVDVHAAYTLLSGLQIDNTSQQGIFIAAESNIVENAIVRGASSSSNNGYAYIEVAANKPGNAVRNCIFDTNASVAVKGSAGLEVGGNSIGTYGPNQMQGASCTLSWDIGAASGGVTTEYTAGATVTNNAAVSIGNSATTPVPFDAEPQDTNSFHDVSTNNTRLTIPNGLGGTYIATASIEFAANATGARRATFYVDGAAVLGAASVPVNSVAYPTALSTNKQMQLAAGQYVEVRVLQDSGGALNVSAWATLSLARIGP